MADKILIVDDEQDILSLLKDALDERVWCCEY